MMMVEQLEKGAVFRALHDRPGAFVMANPWDVGTARLLADLGFEALATTSAGHAFSTGRRDGAIGCSETMTHIASIAAATGLPVSADLGNGFGDDAETVALTIQLAAAAGAVGGSIEDATGRKDDPIYAREHAIERIRAAAQAARGLSHPFVLTARAENLLLGHADLEDTIERLQAYQEAGADVLYAPGLTTERDIATVVSSVDRPVNIVMGLARSRLTLPDLARIGVKRVSVGSALSRAALGTFIRAAREMRIDGSFCFADEAASYREINARFAR